MADVHIQARPMVKDLAELRRMPIGEPFGGRIHWSNGSMRPYFFLKTEEPKGDEYSFLTLPDLQIHQVNVRGADIIFFDAMMMGTVQPLFSPSKARIMTYNKSGAEYDRLQAEVFRSLDSFYAMVKNGPTLRSDEIADAALESLAQQRGKPANHFKQ